MNDAPPDPAEASRLLQDWFVQENSARPRYLGGVLAAYDLRDEYRALQERDARRFLGKRFSNRRLLRAHPAQQKE